MNPLLVVIAQRKPSAPSCYWISTIIFTLFKSITELVTLKGNRVRCRKVMVFNLLRSDDKLYQYVRWIIIIKSHNQTILFS